METFKTERYEACFELYLRYGGGNLSRIEREMRALGYADFNRRILYSRTENGIYKPGWIEKYGWKEFIPANKGGNTSGSECVLPARPIVTPEQGKDALPTGRVSASVSRIPQAFQDWLKSVSPEMTWDWKYQRYIYKYLQQVTDGTCKRLMIFLPPRHGKSELVTVRYAGWRLWNDPKMRIIVSSYNQKLAEKFSRSIRRLLSEEEDKANAERGVRNAESNQGSGSPPVLGGVASVSDDGVVAGSPPVLGRVSSASDDGVVGSPPYQGGVAPASGDGVVLSSNTATEKNHPVGETPPPLLGQEGSFSESSQYGRCQAVEAGPRAARRIFPSSRTINTVGQWETALGGGVKAVGVGAGVTGFGAQLVVIDDPVKSRAEAESQTYRDRLWDWYNNDLYTRLEPNAAIVLIQTRWHQDDLAGRLLREMKDGGDRWEVINLPALAEAGGEMRNSECGMRNLPGSPPVLGGVAPVSGDGVVLSSPQPAGRSQKRSPGPARIDLGSTGKEPPRQRQPLPPLLCKEGSRRPPRHPKRMPPLLGQEGSFLMTPPIPHSALPIPHSTDPLRRSPGVALCPERFDEAKLADIRRQLGGYAFSALYQQQPTPAEGGIFKRAWFDRIVDRAPDGLRWKRGYDLAVSTRTTSCFTASFRVAFHEETGDLYIADGFRKRIEYPDQKRFVIGCVTAEKDTDHGIEKALHGQALIQDLRRESRMHGRGIRGIDVTTDKVTRALKWSALAEEGKVVLVRGPWIREFLDEVCRFPAGQFDDQIDAVSLAVAMNTAPDRRAWSFK